MSLAERTHAIPEIGRDDVYALLSRSNLNYGSAFRAIDRLWCCDETDEIFAELRTDTVDGERYRLHPAILDSALHAMVAGALWMSGAAGNTAYVPAHVDEFRFLRSLGRRLWVHGRGRLDPVSGQLGCELTLITDGNEVVAEVIGGRALALAEEETWQTGLNPEYASKPRVS